MYANPTKAWGHIIAVVCCGVRIMTFNNISKVQKYVAVSKKIQLILWIITDDSGSQCQSLSKFGTPLSRWSVLLGEVRRCGLEGWV